MKINVDGSHSSRTGSSACGGLARDHDGQLIRGFYCKVGSCNAVWEELWGLTTGAFRDGLQGGRGHGDQRDDADFFPPATPAGSGYPSPTSVVGSLHCSYLSRRKHVCRFPSTSGAPFGL